MKRLSILVFIISLVNAQYVSAETTVSSTGTAAPRSSSGTNTTAKQSAGSANSAMMMNAVAAAGFFAAAAAAPPPKKPIFYALAAASVAAGLVMGGGAKNAKGVDNATLAAPNIGGVPAFNPNSEGSGFDSGSGGVSAQLEDMKEELAGLGYVMSDDGTMLSTPNGTVSAADIASGKAPGFDMNDEVRAEMARIEDEAMKKASGAKVVAVGLQDGGGGGGSGAMAGAEEASSRFDMSAYLKGLKNRDPSSISGLSKKLGDDNIGIKSDNIFEMVSRQYKRKESQSAFMK